MTDTFFVWEGRFADFAGAPRTGSGFSDNQWIDRVCERLRALREQPAAERAAVHEYLLAGVTAALAEPGRTTTIIDYGGGVGIEYVQLQSALAGSVKLDYRIVDHPAICAAGAKLHPGDASIRFFPADSLPDERADIVHIGSALQYVEDPDALLRRLTALRPKRLLFSDVYAGDFPAFVSTQNLYGSRVPFHFYNAGELVAQVARHGYELVLRTRFYRKVLGQIGPLPMSNFPPEYRLDYPSHFLFRPAAV